MASLALQLKSHYTKPSQFLLKTTTSNFNFPHFFSSSSSSSNNNNNKNDDEKPSEKPYAFSGYFKDIKSKLKQHEEQQQLSPGFKPFNFTLTENTSSNQPSKDGDFSEIQKNLSEFRRRSTDFSSSPQSQQPNLYQTVGNMRSGGGRTVNLSFDSIRESLRKSGQKGSGMKDAMSLNMHKKSLNFQPVVGGGGKVIGGTTEDLPMNVFGEEMRARERGEGGGDGDDNLLNVELNRMYNHAELGEKLRELRPEVKGKKGKSDEAELFSLSELNERVKKLKEIEVKEMSDKSMGVAFKDLRRSIKSLKGGSDKQMNKNASLQGINLLPQPSLNAPPKENMIERYFHPDNMSSEEKMKLKLKTVRDEFKLHESDCGSTRVQIAQLTTEILHLSSVLHKKDKHSRRGLQAKVQQRKKLLKYLRRTDWESYTFVLSKLGLRDNPDYKN